MSDDSRQQFDRAVNALDRMSLLGQLRDKVVEAMQVGRRECGSCYFWMKSRECPREHNVNGYTRGPSCAHPACAKFRITQQAIDLQAQRIHEAIDFAKRHGLPVPPLTPASP